MERLLSELLVVSDLLVVDVSEADFVDSSFLHNVLVADRRAKEQDKVFRVQMNTAPIVRRAFEVSGVLEHLTSSAPGGRARLANCSTDAYRCLNVRLAGGLSATS